MARSRRKYQKSRPKVRVGLPKKKPNIFKPAFSIPPKLCSVTDASGEWDDSGSVLTNYRSFGVVSNPNFLGVRARTNHIVESRALQVPLEKNVEDGDAGDSTMGNPQFAGDDSGSDLEEDDLKSALGKKRRDGKVMPLQPLTKMQRVYVGQLISKYGDDYERMFMDTKLNTMQHSVATLEKLCKRFYLNGKMKPLS
ncbi:nucleolar protein 16 [Nymphaea colorata]|nr:nucleolar protein 16 [Nymphaea colorata]